MQKFWSPPTQGAWIEISPFIVTIFFDISVAPYAGGVD